MKSNVITPQYNYNGIFLRQIHSFVRRKGRIAPSRIRFIQKYWSVIGVDFELNPLNFLSLFQSNSPIILEIGFGSGKSLIENAIKFPNKNFLGIEVYISGIGSCLYNTYIQKIKNLKIIYHDAYEVVNFMISDHSLSCIQIFFPDPWPKKRHHKRRLLKSHFLKILAKKLMIGGILHIATDSKEYAFDILDQIKDIENYVNLSKKNNFILRPTSRIVTEFEKKAYLKDNRVFDLMFKVKK